MVSNQLRINLWVTESKRFPVAKTREDGLLVVLWFVVGRLAANPVCVLGWFWGFAGVPAAGGRRHRNAFSLQRRGGQPTAQSTKFVVGFRASQGIITHHLGCLSGIYGPTVLSHHDHQTFITLATHSSDHRLRKPFTCSATVQLDTSRTMSWARVPLFVQLPDSGYQKDAECLHWPSRHPSRGTVVGRPRASLTITPAT